MSKGNEQSENGAAGVQINDFLYKIRTKIEQSENGDAELLNFLKDSIKTSIDLNLCGSVLSIPACPHAHALIRSKSKRCGRAPIPLQYA